MKNILLLPGDGIGPEIMAQGQKILDLYADHIQWETATIGGSAIDAHGSPFPDETADKIKHADAVLLGAVGGPKWDSLPLSDRPEKGLLALRKAMGVYANIRPLDIWESLAEFSPLKNKIIHGTSFVIVRELTGGLYFAEPRGRDTENGQRVAYNTLRYSEEEISRIAHTAFKIARQRGKKLCSIDKANVLEAMVLWREIVSEIHAQHYSDITLEHMYVDNAAMQIVRRPSDFDVILSPNMFGDILSDEAAVLPGSLGLLPSASLGAEKGLYEPIHGSAPDIAGQGIANPLGLVLSIAMMMELSLDQPDIAAKIRAAVSTALAQGLRTADIFSEGTQKCSTQEMGDALVDILKA